MIQIAWKKEKLPPSDEVHRILVLRVDLIGDMVLTTPFLRELRRNYTDAEITLVVTPSVYNLVELCPYVDHIMTFKKLEGSIGWFLSFFKARKFVKEHLSNQFFDLAISPRWENDSFCHAGLIMFLSNARRRIGYSEDAHPRKMLLDKGFNHFFTEFVPVYSNDPYEIERHLDVLRYIGGSIENKKLELWTDKSDQIYANQILNTSSKKRIVFCPSASSNVREWDIKNYIQLIKIINQNHDFDIIVIGSRNAESYGRSLEDIFSNVYNLTGKSTLRQTVEIMKKCNFYIGGDTGPMHIAIAVGLPGIVISCHPISGDSDGLNSPIRFIPNNGRMKVIQPVGLPGCKHRCIKKYAHCINQITVEQVYDKIKKYMRNSNE